MTPFMRRMMLGTAAAALPTTTWSPTDKSAAITLSSGNLTATSTGTGLSAVRATSAMASAKYYWEVTVGAVNGSSLQPSIGIANASMALNNYVGSDTNSVAIVTSGGVLLNAASLGAIGAFTAGDVMDVAVDTTAKKIWFRKNGGNWNNDVIANQNPALGVGGMSFSSITGPYFPATSGQNSPNSAVTVNFGATAFASTPPAGFGTMP
jgi:hypothetical protein